MKIVTADIGGTNARFAIATIEGGRVTALEHETTLSTHGYPSLELAWGDFRKQVGDLPKAASIAVAAPVAPPVIQLTNSPWVIRQADLPRALGVDQLILINDFGAVGHAVAHVGPEHLRHLCGPDEALPTDGVISIVGPGTGLGVAHVLRQEGTYHVTETEGGHLDFAPLDQLEDQILVHLRRTLRRVSTERIVSGPGLTAIIGALAAIGGKAMPVGDDTAHWKAAMAGSEPLAVAALDRFFLSLGSVAGDIALAQGGNAMVIAGGLGLRLADRLPSSGFAERFVAKGRFVQKMAAMPVKLLTHPQPGLYGAAAAFARKYG